MPTDADDERSQALFAELYPDLRRFAAVIGDRDIDPDDIVQAAVARVLEGQDLAQLDNPGAYLRATVANLVANERRRFSRRRAAFERLNPTTSELDAYPSDVDFLEILEPLDRAVLFLVHVEGASFDTAAAQLSITAQAARTRASRARRTLRRILTGTEISHD